MLDIGDVMRQVLGIEAAQLTIEQMVMRAIVVYVCALAMVRLGEKRFFGRTTAFDIVLGIILGSVINRTITGNSPFVPTLVASFILVMMHRLFAEIAFRHEWFGRAVKGDSFLLVKNGEIRWDAMRRNTITQKDLLSALRQSGHTDSLEKVEEARMERNGDISFIQQPGKPKVVEIRVEDGVQTVRIHID
jgi:uncharacterized membrane protein YcaP (DUF421 family)